ncbi:ACT domain-containing protein [Tengunoibacter tsumagoiensis]|uniref:Amino acid-binding protein n=1 Tax=Tengunoibacter tsumagoiensis TaxID=2014871 RepID=A0A401ZTM7_9CHLR|nr:ACT domain-containing protein [Tengunoibacter tsumagoiensis]GCE10162.1 amino acid-binding protein [Tengunoibacter tsumagoiensis]
MHKLTLSLFPQVFAICRLHPDGYIPNWALIGDFISLTRTPEELSIICPQENVPEDAQAARHWRCIKVDGPFDFAVSGVHAALALPLAEENISVLSVATYETDYILIQEPDLDHAIAVLKQAGHTFRN